MATAGGMWALFTSCYIFFYLFKSCHHFVNVGELVILHLPAFVSGSSGCIQLFWPNLALCLFVKMTCTKFDAELCILIVNCGMWFVVRWFPDPINYTFMAQFRRKVIYRNVDINKNLATDYGHILYIHIDWINCPLINILTDLNYATLTSLLYLPKDSWL